MKLQIPVCEEPAVFSASEFKNSKFVEVKSNDFFEVSMQYPLLKMKNAEEQCFVRKEVYDMLLVAASSLPKGYKLKILDAWRPFALQKELYEVYSVGIIKNFGLEECTEEEKKSVISRYVSNPIPNKELPPVHTTGGAVDATIIDERGNELDMGTGFDAFTDKTSTSYFESENNDIIRDNRRMLFHAMVNAGFTNLPSEWWHYDYGDRFWGYYKRQAAIYKGIFTKEELNVFK